MSVSLAAVLSGMAARLSTRQLPDAEELQERAESLRKRVEPLVQADAAAYGRVIEAQREDGDVKAALSAAADVPLEVAVRLVEEGNPNLSGDAFTAVLLAEAGTRAAVALADINFSAAGANDGRAARVRELVQAAGPARNLVEG